MSKQKSGFSSRQPPIGVQFSLSNLHGLHSNRNMAWKSSIASLYGTASCLARLTSALKAISLGMLGCSSDQPVSSLLLMKLLAGLGPNACERAYRFLWVERNFAEPFSKLKVIELDKLKATETVTKGCFICNDDLHRVFLISRSWVFILEKGSDYAL